MQTTDIEECVTVKTRYPGQHLRVVLDRETENGDYPEHRQAELVIEAGTRVVIGKYGIRIEALDGPN